MPELTPSQLADAARCETCIPKGMQLPVLIYLFAEVANVSTDPNELMNQAKCFSSCIPRGMEMPTLIYLANQILEGGSSGSACLLAGSGPPVSSPPCVVAIYADTAHSPNLGLWVWLQGPPAQWYEIIASGP